MRMLVLDDIINYSPIPSIEEMLSYDLWEFHEAAFILGGWPKYIFKSRCDNLAKFNKISRSFFYEPSPQPEEHNPLQWEFDPRMVSGPFFEIYESMRKAVVFGELMPKRIEDLGVCTLYVRSKKNEKDLKFPETWVSHLFSRHDIIRWAYLRNINFSEELQDAIGVHIVKEKFDKRKVGRVKNKIVYQFLNEYFPGKKEEFYYNHEWMKLFGTSGQSLDKKLGTIRKETKEFRTEQKQGAPRKEDKRVGFYRAKAMEELISIDEVGKRRYHIPLLKAALITASSILISKFLETYSENGKYPREKAINQFLDFFMTNKVVSLYTEKAPPMILNFIRDWVYETVGGIYLFRNH